MKFESVTPNDEQEKEEKVKPGDDVKMGGAGFNMYGDYGLHPTVYIVHLCEYTPDPVAAVLPA
jgi:hypothetical protein